MAKTRILLLAFCMLCFVASQGYANDRRDKVKAVFLYKFFDYVTWQEKRDPINHPPAVICTMGNVPFGDVLKYLSKKQQKKISNRTQEIRSVNDAASCHMVFASSDTAGILHNASLSNVLTVSDAERFAQNGGMIELKDKPEKVELVINLKAVKAGNLKIRSHLLEIAEVLR